MSRDLGLLMKQARIVREAFQRGELTAAEHCEWLDQLRRPQGLWDAFYDWMINGK